MIYKNEKGTNIIQFGTGDIAVNNSKIYANKTKEIFPCCSFVQHTAGPLVNKIVLDPKTYAPHTTLIFTSEASIDVVIGHLKQAKKNFKKHHGIIS